MRFMLMTYLAAIGLVSFREIHDNERVPKPQAFLFVTAVWVTLSVIGEIGGAGVDRLAAAVAFGFVLVMFYKAIAVSAAEKSPGDEPQSGNSGNTRTGTPAPPYSTP